MVYDSPKIILSVIKDLEIEILKGLDILEGMIK
jgi:hypothetical protein